MLATPTPFPCAGSRAFLKDSADPVTIIRLNADKTALIRRDPRPGEGPHRDASGNREEPLANLYADANEAARGGLPAVERKPRRCSSKKKGNLT